MVFAELAQQVRAEGHRQAGVAHDLQRAQAALADQVDLGKLGVAEAEFLTVEPQALIGNQRRYGDAALLGSKLCGFGLDQVAVLERMDAQFDAAADGCG